MSEKREKTNLIGVRVDDVEKEIINNFARLKGTTAAGVLRLAFFNFYEKETGVNFAAVVQARKNK